MAVLYYLRTTRRLRWLTMDSIKMTLLFTSGVNMKGVEMNEKLTIVPH